MKILQIGSSLYDWGGIERYITYLTEGLMELGHEVDVVCPKDSPLDQRCAGRHHHFALRSQFHIWAIGWYRKLFKRNSYDVVHVHYSPDFVIPARLARASGNSSVIMTRHLATKWTGLKRSTYLATFDRIIAVSDAVKDSLVQDSSVPADRITVAKAGCPVPKLGDRGATRKVLGINGFAIGFFGRLTVEKGVADLMAASSMLPEDSEVHIFGAGPQSEELKAMSNIANVKFHGFIADINDAMNAMDVVAAPSTWAEAFPFSILEAMACGRPVVATSVGGIPEQVDDGKTGLIVPPNSPTELASAITWMHENRSLAEQMGETARRIASTEYTIAAFAARIEGVYSDVLSSKGT